MFISVMKMNEITTEPVNLKGMLPEEIATFIEPMGKKTYRSRQIFKWIHDRGVEDFSLMTDLSKKFRSELTSKARVMSLKVKKIFENEETTKFLFETSDGFGIESVIIRDEDRITFCLSSQVGCALGCTFCRTAQMGFQRNLEVWEIVDQFNRMQKHLKMLELSVTHVVFMGMGEPFLNYENVLSAIRIFMNTLGAGLGQRRLTVSTAGVVPRIYNLAESGLKVGLAVSLNAPTDELRYYIMPFGEKYAIKDILEASWEYARKTGRWVTFEYVLLREINDSDTEAQALLKLIRGKPAKVNLIAYNEVEGNSYNRPSDKRIEQFQKIMFEGGIVAILRKSKGQDINAACGQLATNMVKT